MLFQLSGAPIQTGRSLIPPLYLIGLIEWVSLFTVGNQLPATQWKMLPGQVQHK